MSYKIYTIRNLADTWRDQDEFVYEQLGLEDNIEDATKIAEDYIKNHFFHKNTKLTKGTENIFMRAFDCCSYGAEIIIEKTTNNNENDRYNKF